MTDDTSQQAARAHRGGAARLRRAARGADAPAARRGRPPPDRSSRCVNLGGRRAGLAPGTEDERDLEQVARWRSRARARCCRCSRPSSDPTPRRSATRSPSCRWPTRSWRRRGRARGPPARAPAAAAPEAEEPAPARAPAQSQRAPLGARAVAGRTHVTAARRFRRTVCIGCARAVPWVGARLVCASQAPATMTSEELPLTDFLTDYGVVVALVCAALRRGLRRCSPPAGCWRCRPATRRCSASPAPSRRARGPT